MKIGEGVKTGVLPRWCRWVCVYGDGQTIVPFRTKKEALAEDDIVVDEMVGPDNGPGPGIKVSRLYRSSGLYRRDEFEARVAERLGNLKYAEQFGLRDRIRLSVLCSYFRYWWDHRNKR